MNHSTAVFLINDHVRAIMGVYESDDKAKRVMFKTLDPTIKVGDYVLVPTETRHKMSVNKVVECDVDVDFDSSVHVAWVIAKIDRAPYDTILVQEADAIQTIGSAEVKKKRDDLREALLANAGALKALPIASVD